MSLASAVIRSAYRESQIIAISGSPTTAETTEAIARLNSLILSVMGSEVGQEFNDLIIGGEFDQSPDDFAPVNTRLVLKLSAARTVKLNPYPFDGERFAVADAGANLATYNLTLNPNGRRIEAAATLVLATNSLARQWLYRADTGNWVRVTDLAAADEMPFPSEFDDYFITALAMRLNPRHGAQMAQESAAAYKRQLSQLQARYRRPRPRQDLGTLGMMGGSFGSEGLL